MSDPALLSASQQAAAIRDKSLSSRELLDAQLRRIERLNTDINAVVTLDEEVAIAGATQADAAAARGEWAGPLHGLSITIKDAIEVEAMRSTGGAIELTDHVPDNDAPAVTKLRRAGAIVFGKTNVPRWSGDLQAFNEMFGTTNNPWNLARVPGGSSGGPAAAVATGMSSFELGTDIGGSIRVPSHFCGVFGHKPSFGIVSQRGYLDHVGGGTTDADINVFGPIARSADDLAMLLDVLVGPDADRAPAWRVDLPPSRAADVSGLRIAAWLDEPGVPQSAAYRSLLDRTGELLEGAGAKVDVGARPQIDYATLNGLFIQLVGAAVSIGGDESQGMNHTAWLRTDKERTAARAVWAEFFERYDALLCPVTPTPAFPHTQEGGWLDRSLDVDGASVPYFLNMSWTGIIGVSYLPSTVPPIGLTAEGLPVGVQVVGPYLGDRTTIDLARHIAAITDGYRVPPIAQ